VKERVTFHENTKMPKAATSARKVERINAYQAKQGSRATGTDAAHRMSWELYNAVGAHMPGRPAKKTAAVALSMGAASNLRIKSDYGNRTLDHRRDERIGAAFAAGEGLYEKSTANRAKQATLRAWPVTRQCTRVPSASEACPSTRAGPAAPRWSKTGERKKNSV